MVYIWAWIFETYQVWLCALAFHLGWRSLLWSVLVAALVVLVLSDVLATARGPRSEAIVLRYPGRVERLWVTRASHQLIGREVEGDRLYFKHERNA